MEVLGYFGYLCWRRTAGVRFPVLEHREQKASFSSCDFRSGSEKALRETVLLPCYDGLKV